MIYKITNFLKIKIIFFLILISFVQTEAQRFLKYTVTVGDRTEYLSYFSRRGVDYVSAKELAKILSGNYYYNEEACKIEMKFQNYNLKITARNQFIILYDKKRNSKRIYQIPISTLLIRDDVFVPIDYCLKYVSQAYQKNIVAEKGEKNLAISLTPFKEENNSEIRNKVEPKTEQENIKEIAVSKEKKYVNSKYDVYGMDLIELVNGTLINFHSKEKLIKVSKPSIVKNSLWLTISNVTIDPAIAKNYVPTGFIKSFKLKKISWKNYQLEFRLKSGYSNVDKSYNNDHLQISIHSKIYERKPLNYEKEKQKWKLDVVVIDAGHGGKDPGAIGVKKTKEKDITLKLALKLGKAIQKKFKNEIKVKYTRTTDKFVELYERGKIANEADGKLFISIHCNSVKRKPSNARGFEVYLLRPGRTKEAIEIAEFENSVIELETNPERYKKLTDENFILVSMAHSAFMRYSETFSSHLNTELKKASTIPSRGIKQAGFYVLVGASMPGILFEAGFLSNREDEKYLKSNSGQNEIVKGMLNAIISYKNYYDKMITSGN